MSLENPSHSFGAAETKTNAAWDSFTRIKAPTFEPFVLAQLEKERLQTKQFVRLTWGLAIVAGILTLVGTWIVDSNGYDPRLTVLPGGTLTTLLRIAGAKRKLEFAKRYLSILLPSTLSQYDESLAFDYDAGIDQEAFDEAELRSYKTYHSDRAITGRLQETEFSMAAILLNLPTHGLNFQNQKDAFAGVHFVADFNKHFRSKVQVLPDNSENSLWGLGRKAQANSRNDSVLTRMDNQEFEDAFKIYVTDEVEARYILTQDLMARILDMRKQLHPEISLSFHGSKLSILVPAKDFLKVDINVPADHDPAIQALLQEIDSFISIVDSLNLNQRIWTKE